MIRKGDVLRHKLSKDGHKVMAVTDGLVAMSYSDDHENLMAWYSDSQMKAAFDLPKEKWRPEEGKEYYYMLSNGKISNDIYAGDDMDWSVKLYEMGNCFRTREEAEAKAEEVRGLLGK